MQVASQDQMRHDTEGEERKQDNPEGEGKSATPCLGPEPLRPILGQRHDALQPH